MKARASTTADNGFDSEQKPLMQSCVESQQSAGVAHFSWRPEHWVFGGTLEQTSAPPEPGWQ